VISGPVAFAFAAGIVATFNPCGFALLPAYIGAFVAGDDVTRGVARRLLRAGLVAGAVSIGFVAVFAGVGVIIDQIAGSIREKLPWVTIAIGGLLIVAGAAMVFGRQPGLRLRIPRFSLQGTSLRVMIAYGITFAIASLSCTIGPFLAATGAALDESALGGLAAYLAYALGMGLVILVIGVASSLAHSSVTTSLRRLSRFAGPIGGWMMIIAGGYAIWYGRWELAVNGGDFRRDPVVDVMENVRLWVVDWIERIGGRGLIVVAVVLGVALLAGRPWARADSADAHEVDLEKTGSLEG